MKHRRSLHHCSIGKMPQRKRKWRKRQRTELATFSRMSKEPITAIVQPEISNSKQKQRRGIAQNIDDASSVLCKFMVLGVNQKERWDSLAIKSTSDSTPLRSRLLSNDRPILSHVCASVVFEVLISIRIKICDVFPTISTFGGNENARPSQLAWNTAVHDIYLYITYFTPCQEEAHS